MPLGPVAEAIVSTLVEWVLQLFGYLTARALVPVLTLGTFCVAPCPRGNAVRPGFGRVRRSSAGDRVIDAELGALLGVLFWLAIGLGVATVSTPGG